MTDMIRPGPESIDAGACPGGLVIRVYGVDGRLLAQSILDAMEDVPAEAVRAGTEAAGKLRPDEVMILVFYDGDDGHRMTPPPPHFTGQRLP